MNGAALTTAVDSKTPLLEIKNLRVGFGDGAAIVTGLDLRLFSGRFTALIGDSGAGKSLTALALMQLLPASAWIEADLMRFDAQDLLGLTDDAFGALRGSRLGMISQSALSALNPVMTIGEQIIEAYRAHFDVGRDVARSVALDLLQRLRFSAPDQQFRSFPHELSGGMRQRAMIAMAIICRPKLLIADEPTTALDASTRRTTLLLLNQISREFGTTVLFITHDLSLIDGVADEIAVMYAGRIVEHGSPDAILSDPMHPYTLALLTSRPQAQAAGQRLMTLGDRQIADQRLDGCCFIGRCPLARGVCANETPALRELKPGHGVACWLAPLEENAS